MIPYQRPLPAIFDINFAFSFLFFPQRLGSRLVHLSINKKQTSFLLAKEMRL
jgi:hypothetical protein